MTAIEFRSPLVSLRAAVVDTALGEDADRIRRTLSEAASAGTSIALGDPVRRLEEALEEAAHDDWDGYGALRVSAATGVRARSFLQALPLSVLEVDIMADPDGELVFEWCVSPDWILTVAINQHGRLAYSGLFGPGRVRGTEFFGDALPATIAIALARLCHRTTEAQTRGRRE